MGFLPANFELAVRRVYALPFSTDNRVRHTDGQVMFIRQFYFALANYVE